MKTIIINNIKKYKETVFYLIFGVLTTLISIAVFMLLCDFGLKATIANTIATVIAVVFAFVTNKIYVFESKNFAMKAVINEFLKFTLSRFATYLIETAILFVFVDTLNYNSTYLKILTSILIIILNYILSKKAVFTQK